MSRTVRIMRASGEVGHDDAANPHRAALEEAATQLLATVPRIFSAMKHQARATEAGAPSHDLGDTQIWVLYALSSGTDLTSGLARRFNVTNPTMTRIVDALVEKGYAERHPDVEDRRRIYLRLTDKGTEVARGVHGRFRGALSKLISSLSDDQLSDVIVACHHLASILPGNGQDFQGFCPANKTNNE